MNFDTSKFEELINKFGIKTAWMNLLATHINANESKFHYILEDKLFHDSEILIEDLLNGLSIGEIGVLYEYCVALVDVTSRKDNGQFFTPDDVALLMVEQSKKFPIGKWLDPCSGIGNLSWHLVNAQLNKEEFLINSMILSDKDSLALTIARVYFTISFQDKHQFLFYEIEKCFILFDFLSASDSGMGTIFNDSSLENIPLHDYVIVNPPYLSMKGEDTRFETSKSRDLYAYFLENIIKTSKGFISITPQSFTNASKFRELRKLLISNYETLKIYTFDNIPGNIFYGIKFGSTNSNSANSIRAAIIVAGYGSSGHRITSLLRWRTSERAHMFANIDKFLSSPTFTPEYFPKVSSVFIDLYDELQNRPSLDSLLSHRPSKYVLYIPASPRYFISALKKPVSRASIKMLHFNSAEDLNRAYLLLNSSLMYWWWRVRDGGMTLSLETLKSLPVPEFDIDQEIIRDLEKSEISNKVFKLNAGARHENVKHDGELIRKLNAAVIPKFSEILILTHENSELVQIVKEL